MVEWGSLPFLPPSLSLSWPGRSEAGGRITQGGGGGGGAVIPSFPPPPTQQNVPVLARDARFQASVAVRHVRVIAFAGGLVGHQIVVLDNRHFAAKRPGPGVGARLDEEIMDETPAHTKIEATNVSGR